MPPFDPTVPPVNGVLNGAYTGVAPVGSGTNGQAPLFALSPEDQPAMMPTTVRDSLQRAFPIGGNAYKVVGATKDYLTGALQDLATLGPIRRLMDAAAEDAQHPPGEPGYVPQAIGPAAETAMLLMGGGAFGAPARAGEAVLGAGPVRRVPSAGLPGSATLRAIGPTTEATAGPQQLTGPLGGIADKASARLQLNQSSRVIDRYAAKHQAWSYDGGPALSPTERAEWTNAFKRKQAAQQYLDSTQVPDL